jgi:sporulation protein YlmC with PRC-barrel domain
MPGMERRRLMNSIRNLLATAATAALVALPASALTLGVDAGLGVDVGEGSGATAGATTSAEAASTMTLKDGTVAQIDAGSAFNGNAVLSSDGEQIGAVESVMIDADGGTHLIINADDSLQAPVESFSVNAGADAQSDGQVQLPWSKAELELALSAQVEANGNGG